MSPTRLSTMLLGYVSLCVLLGHLSVSSLLTRNESRNPGRIPYRWRAKILYVCGISASPSATQPSLYGNTYAYVPCLGLLVNLSGSLSYSQPDFRNKIRRESYMFIVPTGSVKCRLPLFQTINN